MKTQTNKIVSQITRKISQYGRERQIVLGKHLHGRWENLVDGYILVSPEMLTDFFKRLTFGESYILDMTSETTLCTLV